MQDYYMLVSGYNVDEDLGQMIDSVAQTKDMHGTDILIKVTLKDTGRGIDGNAKVAYTVQCSGKIIASDDDLYSSNLAEAESFDAAVALVELLGFSTDTEEEFIILTDVDGIAILSGKDVHGSQWTQFEVDYLADQVAGICSICEEEIESGWMCLDGGDEVCSDHVITVGT